MSLSNTTVMEAVVYEPLMLPPISEITPVTMKAYLHEVTLNCQGNDVIINEAECTSLQLAAAFKLIFLRSEEAIFHTIGGESILLFSHRELSPLRPTHINERFTEAISAARVVCPLFSSIANPLPSSTIDLTKFPNANEDSSIEHALAFISELATKVTPAYAVTLNGPVTPLLLFASCLLLFPRSQVIEYKQGNEIVRII